MSRQHSSGSPSPESAIQESSLGSSPIDQHGYASASTSPHRMSLGSEGYPSWLPQRPPPPAPTSTFQSSFGRHGGPSSSEPSPMWGGRKPTPRSVRIVSVPDSENGRREPTDQTRVSGAYPHHARVWSRATSSGIPPTLFSSAPPRPKFRSKGLHLELLRHPSWKFRLYFYLFPLFVFVHIPIQTFLDFNAVFILLQVAKYPNPQAPGIPGSGRNWALGAAAYTACWLAWISVVLIVYEILYSFARRWRVKRPLMVPLYLSSPAFSLVSMTSYANFCVMYHIRYSAFFGENGGIRDGLAETFWYYSQNLPTVGLLLPRAGLSLALLFSFGHPDPDTVALADTGLLHRDGTFFRKSDGTLTGYARGVLIANAAWTAWRILVLLISWVGLWALSGQACAGLCGPRYRWEEEEHEKSASFLSETESDVDSLPWSWRECTRLRIQEAFEFCLTIKPSARWGKKDVSDDVGPSLPPVSPSPGFEGVEQVLAAIGFPSAPQPARRGVLSDELFESPTDEHPPAIPGPDVSSIIPKIKKMNSKERQDMGPSGPLLALPYPFTAKGAQVSSEDRIPFPPSPRSSSKKKSSSSGSGALVDDDEEDDDDDDDDDEEEEEEEEEDDEEEGEEDGANASGEPSSGRASGSMSSLGQPVSSRYPFQFRSSRRSSGGGSQMSPGPMSSPSSHSHSRSIHSAMSRSTGNGESSDSQSPRSNTFSIHSIPGGIPMPPRHPQQGGRGRARTGSVPATAFPSASVPLAFPTSRSPQTRSRTDSGVSQTFGAEPAVYESNGEEDYSDEEVMMEQPEPEGPHEEAETEDVVGLLSPSSAGPSPRTSFVGLRSRSSSHRQRRQRSRSGSNSPSNSHSGSGSSSSRSRAGSSLSAAARLRTQSLIQAISSASKSSVDLVQSARRSRANSSMARLEEDIPYFSDVHTHSRSGSDALSSGENYTFGVPPFGHPLHPLRAQIHAAPEGVSQAVEAIPTVARAASSSNLQPSPSNLSVAAPSENHSEQTVSNITERALEHPEVEEEFTSRTLDKNVEPSVTSHPDISTASPSFVTAPPTVEGTTDSSSGMQPSSWGGVSHMVEKSGGPWGPA